VRRVRWESDRTADAEKGARRRPGAGAEIAVGSRGLWLGFAFQSLAISAVELSSGNHSWEPRVNLASSKKAALLTAA
jgi:hypothetical protein